MRKERGYRRQHLRAPFHFNTLYADQGFVFKAKCLNISEGGMLMDQIPYFPDHDRVPLMLSIPQFPSFKNFNYQKLRDFSFDLFPKKVVRLKCQVVRKFGIESDVDQIMASRVGVSFTDIDPVRSKIIAEYVEGFLSNITHLLAMIDSVNYDEQALPKIRELASLLGYNRDIKISTLRKIISQEYLSLQWL